MNAMRLLRLVLVGTSVLVLGVTLVPHASAPARATIGDPVPFADESGATPDSAEPPIQSSGAVIPASAPDTAVVRPAPRDIRAIYLTSWSAATPGRVTQAIKLIEDTELNGVVIDIKDYTGRVVFMTSSPVIHRFGSEDARLGNLADLVSRFHQSGVYVTVRVAGFQDQHLLKVRPDLAVRDTTGRIWRDRKGLGWVDPASREVWEYLVEIGRAAAQAGVDELNFDYIRFPSDGNLSGLRYPIFDENATSKREVLRQFFEFLTTALRPTGAVLSADLFGLATVRPDDLGIGQILEDALLYFDYVSPMVYPSHYARGFLQFKNPAAHPYEVVRYSLERAEWRRAQFARMLDPFAAAEHDHGSSIDRLARIRPWLQAFDLGAPYPPSVIRTQMKAVYDTGLDFGWYLWNPSNKYLVATFEEE